MRKKTAEISNSIVPSDDALRAMKQDAEKVIRDDSSSPFDKREQLGAYLLADMLLEKDTPEQLSILQGLLFYAEPEEYYRSKADKHALKKAIKGAAKKMDEAFPEEVPDRRRRRAVSFVGGMSRGSLAGIFEHRITVDEPDEALSDRELLFTGAGAATGGALNLLLHTPLEASVMKHLSRAALRLYEIEGRDLSPSR